MRERKRLNIKYNICFIILVAVVITFSSCNSNGNKKENSIEAPKSGYSNIEPAEAKIRLESETNIVLLDVRTQEEYAEGHIENSLLIPVDVLEEEAEVKLSDKEAPIFVYCRSGNRSVTASKILIDLGYKNVYNLGGIKDWPYEIVK